MHKLLVFFYSLTLIFVLNRLTMCHVKLVFAYLITGLDFSQLLSSSFLLLLIYRAKGALARYNALNVQSILDRFANSEQFYKNPNLTLKMKNA